MPITLDGFFCCCSCIGKNQAKEKTPLKQYQPPLSKQKMATANNNYPTVEDAYIKGKKLMRRGTKSLGTLNPGAPEDTRFRSMVGTSALVCVTAWSMMVQHDLLPPEHQFVHYLLALLFMKVYPNNETALCTLCGGKDPKTVRRYIWPNIFSLYELNFHVVRVPLHFQFPIYMQY